MNKYKTIHDIEFNKQISLTDAYKIMEVFVADYLKRGDTSVSDFLYTYASMNSTGMAIDPAAVPDFITASKKILNHSDSILPHERTRRLD